MAHLYLNHKLDDDNCNECEAKQTFKRYKNCTRVYMILYNCGTPVTKLAVAV